MEKHEELIKKAIKKLRTADHLLYVTMPVVNDNKLLLTILENLNLSVIDGMNSILEYERLYKRIGPLNESFGPRFNVFKQISKRLNFSSEELTLIMSLKTLLEERKESPLEFSRKDKVVICSDSYKMKTVSLNEIKDFIVKVKSFLRKVEVTLK